MEIKGATTSFPNLYDKKSNTPPEITQSGSSLPHPETPDLLEISDQARQIVADINHEAIKVRLSDRPIGAPEDYVPASAIMQRFDEEGYNKMNALFQEGKSELGLSLMLAFAKKLPQHPEWLDSFKRER